MEAWGWAGIAYLALSVVCICVFHRMTSVAPIDPFDEFAEFKNTDDLFAPTDPIWNYDEESDDPLHADGSGHGSERLPARPGPGSACTSPYHGSVSYARTYACSCDVCKYLRGHVQ